MTLMYGYYMMLDQQHGRIRPPEPTYGLAGMAQLDAMTFAWQCAGFLSMARLAQKLAPEGKRRAISAAIGRFNRAAPHVKDLRDIVSHPDDYVQLRGRLQQKPKASRKDPDEPIDGVCFSMFFGNGTDFTLYVTLGSTKILQISVGATAKAAHKLVSAIDHALDGMQPSHA